VFVKHTLKRATTINANESLINATSQFASALAGFQFETVQEGELVAA